MPIETAPEEALPCPECRMKGRGGKTRIGNHRGDCKTCNAWAQNVMRMTRTRLIAQHSAEYKSIRAQVEKDLYPQVIDDFTAEFGLHEVMTDGSDVQLPDDLGELIIDVD